MHVLDGRPMERCSSAGCDMCEGAPVKAPLSEWALWFAQQEEGDKYYGFATILREMAEALKDRERSDGE